MVKRSPSQQGGTCPLSEIRVTTISDAAGTGPVTLTKQHAAKAWNNTNNTGTTINESFNISSLTDTSTGRQNHNVTSNFNTTTYCPQMNLNNNNYDQQWVDGLQANTWKTNNFDGSAYQDARIVTVAFGDLA